MSSYTYRYEYTPEDYAYDAMDEYGYTTSPSSFGGGGHAMAATNSSQSMSSYAESPPSYGWSTEQQQDWYPIYNTTSPTPQAYFAPTEDPAYPSQAPYQQPAQRSQPAQEPPRSQRSTTETAPAGLVCLVPGCETNGRFKRRADLLRHMNTVHEVRQRWNCPRPRCDRKAERGFSRRDHLYEHLRNTHNVEVPTGGERRRRGEAAA